VLEAVPNISEGRRPKTVEAVGRALGRSGAKVLDVHSDADHNRSVFTLVGEPQELADALVAGARAAVDGIDMRIHEGVHPCIGALDVAPVVYLRQGDRALAVDEALAVANRLAGELELPVFLYGMLATDPDRRERAHFREGGVRALEERLTSGELEPDFGPPRLHPTAGATLVACRPPLVAFNLELGEPDLNAAKAIAAEVREAGGGLPGVRAIGVLLERAGAAQVSINVQDPFEVPLAEVVRAAREAAVRHRADIRAGQLVGLAPEAALDGFPPDLELKGFDESAHVLEKRLTSQR
jgi:glutamate formiminotransferase/glutamate formiminotransferase/formiminotetrahydrofolate cyclodeaminase